LSGVVAAVLTVAGLAIVGDAPGFLDDAATVADYYADNSSQVIVASYIGLLGTVAFIWFVGVLRTRLGSTAGGDERLATIAFGGGIAAAAPLLAIYLFNLAGAFRADEDGKIDPGVAASLYDLSALSVNVAAIAASVLVLAVGLLALRDAVLPRWLGIVSVLLGIAMLLPFAYVAMGVFLIWLAVLAVLLWLRGPGEHRPRRPAAGRMPA
jgi:hypothetical protein